MAKPFLKWAGGKTQLLASIKQHIPVDLKQQDFTYVEPFAGSSAVFFWMLKNYPTLNKAIINDINLDLINCYKTIQSNVADLIKVLLTWQKEYHQFENDTEAKKEYYYDKRQLFNSHKSKQTIQSALFIFLNRTCFNGLYRVNRKNEFNVPIGSYKKPQICNQENLLNVAKALQNVELLSSDYQKTIQHIKGKAFFYLDPPYKPLNETSSFTAYAKGNFNDDEQVRLKEFCHKLDDLGFKWILSNSDVKNTNPDNNFFDDLYDAFSIKRVLAKRSINSNANKRGQLTELLITN